MSEKVHRVLHLEDVAADAELVENNLRAAGLQVCVKRVSTDEAFEEAIGNGRPDVILADSWLPHADSGKAFALTMARCPDVPFIFVSGAMEEDFAIECVKRGAADYIFKDRLDRLGLEVERALAERERRAELRRIEKDLRASEERCALVIRAIDEAVWDWDLTRNTIYYSGRWKGLLGLRNGDLGDRPEAWFDRVHPEDLPRLKSGIDLYLKGITPHLENEHRLRHEDGTDRWVRVRGVSSHDKGGAAVRLVGTLSDTTGRKRGEEELRKNAFFDPMTGLPNRALFRDRLGEVMRRVGRRRDSAYATLLVAIDCLKDINDSFGRRAGDAVLLELSRRLTDSLRGGDSHCRLESDIFAILVEDFKGPADSGVVAERIRRTLAPPVQLGSSQIFVTVGMGMAIGGLRYERPEELIEDAETALSRAKRQGRSGYQIFEVGMHENARKALELERDLRRALQKQHIVPYFQPLVLLRDGAVVGAEALVRWVDPSKGVMAPADFLPVAEKSGLIPEIDAYVLRAVAAQIRGWKKAGLDPVPVSVNCSARTLEDMDVPGLFRQSLDEFNLEPGMLKLELTESDVMQNAEKALAKLRAVSAEGVGIHLDDFGTGYSSLSYLLRLPLSALKIDRSFVNGVHQDPGAATLSDAIVSMGHRLGLRVIAEGVESREQADVLREMGCEEAQGYFYGKPVPACDFVRHLEKAVT